MKQIFKKKYFVLVLIIILAFFLRFYHLGQNPPSLTWDEAAWGYNAYSLGIDGKDEFGRFLPLNYLESFGDFKPPMYAYLDVIPVKFFGLNEFSTRFPSALFGVLTIVFTYFLVKRIFYNSENKEKYALFSSFFLAISPWHILLSRAAFEANVASFFIVFGIYCFLKGVQEKGWFIVLSAVSFVFSMYTFNSSRVVAPILVTVLSILFFKRLLLIKKQVVVALLLGLVLMLPSVKFLLSPQASLRFKEVNIFSDSSVVATSNQEIANDNFAWWSRIIHNRRIGYAKEFMKHYFDNLNPIFLFIRGDGNPKFSIQTIGQMYWWDIPFFIGGILFLMRKKEGYWYVIPLWLILSIVPAATARETPHALRIENALPTFQILTAYGCVVLLDKIRRFRRLIISIIFFALFLNFSYFYHDYFVHYARVFSGEWQYGYKDSIKYVENVGKNYDQINVTEDLGRPYIYYLYYLKIDPNFFRVNAEVKRDAFGFVKVSGFGKYKFADNLSEIGNVNKNVLYVDTIKNVPGNAQVLKTFNRLDGTPTLKAYTQ